MRVLATCLPGYGHFLPMLALSRALVDAGHEVAFATAAGFCPRISNAGFATFAAGLSLPEQLRESARRFPEHHGLPLGKERFETFVPRMLAGVAAPARAADLVPIVRDWQPDLLLHDETDLGGPVAAAVAGVPYADHSVGWLRPLDMARLARETIAPLWEEWDVDLGEFGGLFRYLYLDVCPPSLQSPEIDLIDVARPLRNTDIRIGHGDLPDWVHSLRPAPTVYVSLGTLFGEEDTFATILEGLRDEYLNVIVTVGNDNDPAALGPQPDHVHVERFIPQSALLPHCDAVINQGGTAILPILAQALPLLVLPQSANQFHQAEACVQAGVARALRPGEVTPGSVQDAIRTLLSDPSYGVAARRVAAEFAALPAPDRVVPLLERLARTRTPVTREGAVS